MDQNNKKRKSELITTDDKNKKFKNITIKNNDNNTFFNSKSKKNDNASNLLNNVLHKTIDLTENSFSKNKKTSTIINESKILLPNFSNNLDIIGFDKPKFIQLPPDSINPTKTPTLNERFGKSRSLNKILPKLSANNRRQEPYTTTKSCYNKIIVSNQSDQFALNLNEASTSKNYMNIQLTSQRKEFSNDSKSNNPEKLTYVHDLKKNQLLPQQILQQPYW